MIVKSVAAPLQMEAELQVRRHQVTRLQFQLNEARRAQRRAEAKAQAMVLACVQLPEQRPPSEA